MRAGQIQIRINEELEHSSSHNHSRIVMQTGALGQAVRVARMK